MLSSLRVAVVLILSVSLFYAPLFALRGVGIASAQEKQPAAKASPRQFAAHEPDTLLIKFRPEATAQTDYLLNAFGRQRQTLRGSGGVVKLRLKPGLDFNTTLDALSRLEATIEWVEPNYLVKRASGKVSSSRHAAKTVASKNASSAKRPVAASNTTIIAVIDSGVDLNHRELKPRLWANEAEKAGERLSRNGLDDDRNGFADDLHGWNFVADNGDVRDDLGHGTQVAGVIAQAAGIQRESSIRLLPLKALDQSGTGTIADIVEAMDYAVARHVAVINCSFGTAGHSQALLAAVKRAETAGIIVVAAAGNDAKDLSQSPFYPAAFSRSHGAQQSQNLISVAATEEARPGEVRLAGYSNFNADIAAPGTLRTTHLNNDHVDLTGTSAAAASVAGAAARLKNVRGWVSAQTVRDSLLESAQESPRLLGALAKISSRGSVNPQAALARFTRETSAGKAWQRGNGKPPELTPEIRAALRAGANLDRLRNDKPQRPDPRPPIGTPVGTPAGTEPGNFNRQFEYATQSLPGPNYDDPKPTVTANYNAYLTELSKAANAAGPAGSQPMQTVDPTAGSAGVGGFSYNLDSKNYNFLAPVMSLGGRAGLDLSLALSYNSNVWVRDTASNTVAFNADRGFPAPGWRLSFGAIQIHTNTTGGYANAVTGQNSIIYIAPDGTRRDMALIPGTSKYKTYDSSYLVFDAAANVQTMYFPNGTQAKYGAYSYDPSNYDFQALPIEIKDRNGNFITITYKTLNCGGNGFKTVIDQVTDTAGRQFVFGYQNNRLTSVSQILSGPGWTMYYWYVYINYDPVTIQTNFGGATTDPANINGTVVYFPTRITYPTGVNYRFNYTSYGQISAIEKWVPTITGQGTERKVASTSFDVPTYNQFNVQYVSPSFSNRYEWAESWNAGNIATYQYTYNGSSYEVMDPTYRRFQLQTAGLTQTQYIWAQNAGNWTKKDETIYTSDSGLSYLSNLRPIETKKTANGSAGVTVKRTTISYTPLDGMWLPENKDEFINGTTALYRRTKLTYTSKPAQYILGLVDESLTYNAASLTVPIARTKNYYDEAGYLVDASGAQVIQHDNNYNAGFSARGNLTGVEQFWGATATSRFLKRVTYDTNGNVRAETAAAGNAKQIDYTDNYSNKPSGIGQTHAYAYTAADPIGFRAGSQWNYFLGQPVKTFNLTPGSSTETQVSTITYDFANRVLRVTRPDGGWTQTDYWDNWLATTISTDVGGGNIGRKYEQFDGAGRTFKKGSDHPDAIAGKYSGQVIVTDKVGQVTDTSNVLAIDGTWTPAYEDWSNSFLFTHLTRDELSRLKIITYPDGNTRQVNYDGCGCAGNTETRVTDELGHETITKTDFMGRLVEATEPDTSVSDGIYSRATYHYDELDRLLAIEHRGRYNGITGLTATQYRYFSYDGYGRLQNETTPEGGTVWYSYTANDLVHQVYNQRNITVTNSYNSRNLLTGVSYSDGTPSVGFSYDDFGARTSMTDGEGQTTYSYNGLRQLESETRTFTALSGNYYKFSYSYNVAGQPTQVNYGVYTLSGGGNPVYSFNKNVNYDYNGVSALKGIGTNLLGSNPNTTTNVISAATYRASGAVNVLNYGNGRRLTMGYYQQRSQPASMKVDLAGNPADKIIDYAYDYYDANGANNNRIRKITDHVDGSYTTTYTYDQYNRMTHSLSSAYNGYYQYDNFGNVTNFQGMTINYATNASGAPATNRISTAVNGSTTYTHSYDNAGNLTDDGQQTYAYDGANRLKQAGASGQSTYGYDGNGARVRKTESGAALFYVRSSVLGAVAMEVNSSSVVRAYVNLDGRLIAQQASDGNFYWTHKNHLDSGHMLTDSTGALKFRSEYSAYGQLLLDWSASGASNPSTRKFTGYERDAATGLDYADARMYGSNYGRFMTADPAGQKAATMKRPQSFNRYAYVGNDPVNYVDPKGTTGVPASLLVWLQNRYVHIRATLNLQIGVPGSSGYAPLEDGSTGGVVEAQIPKLKNINKEARDHIVSFLDKNPGCDQFLLGAGFDYRQLDSHVQFIDARDDEALLETLGSAWGDTDPVEKNWRLRTHLNTDPAIAFWESGVVFIGSKIDNTAYTPDKGLVFTHEILHIAFRANHKELAEKLGIKAVDGREPSKHIDDFLNNNCGVPR